MNGKLSTFPQRRGVLDARSSRRDEESVEVVDGHGIVFLVPFSAEGDCMVEGSVDG